MADRPDLAERPEPRAALAAVLMTICAFITWTARPFTVAPDFTASAAVAVQTTGPPPYGLLTPPATVRRAIQDALFSSSFPALSPSLTQVGSAYADGWTTCGNVSNTDALDRCTYRAASTDQPARSIVVLGDSFAISWLPTVRALQADGYTVRALTYGQCPAADVHVEEGVGAQHDFTAVCDHQREWALQQVAQLRPDIVVLASYGATVDRLAGGVKGAAAIREWKDGTDRTVQRVLASGVRRVVLLSSPPVGPSLTSCAPTPTSSPLNCVGRVDSTWYAVADAERSVARARSVTYLDTRLYFCSAQDYCPSFIGHTPVRVDGAHLTDAYARSLGQYLAPLIAGR